MEVLVLDGKSYIKASKAAKNLGYATDYVGQLCRSGQVDAHLIGRTWYVNEDELGTHRAEKKRMSRVKAREYAKKTIAEYKVQNDKTTNAYNNIAIRYEKDEENLIPDTKKLLITSEISKKNFERHAEEEVGNETVTLNKGEKVLMSGDLSVVDVTDGEIDIETTVLKPSHIRKGVEAVSEPKEAMVRTIKATEAVDSTENELVTTSKKVMSFAERLQAQDAIVEDEPIITEESDVINEDAIEESSNDLGVTKLARPSMLFCVLMLCVVTLLSVGMTTFSIFSTYTRTQDGNLELSNSYKSSPVSTISIIKLKI